VSVTFDPITLKISSVHVNLVVNNSEKCH